MNIGDMQGALESFDRCIALKSDADLFLQRSGVKYMLKDYEGAMNDCNEALKINRNSARAYYNKGLLNEEINYNYIDANKLPRGRAIEVLSGIFDTIL